uniref:Large ribosomal subunit protein bL21c n=1 Tax=Anthoceros angustus TaxID=48387 RepID=RK21_ANTAG|nr:ribosomal protein L21 [Anthoceros angustus]Q85AT7.1 RecName: Full=Large ribosomal subunit protein bL21c; AltName: Full=50S ribosomal protein L21, chloroplastic [Anthoceros angustus]BAC55397.1 ribosomal protein L21 [Anthoceros angustus]BAC55497.1 ribosomal protein L21 [Anthoceros angustus]
MNTYAIIDTGGEQLRVEPGRFYDMRHFTLLNPSILDSNTKVLIYRVLMIHHESNIALGDSWLEDATIKGRVLHSHFKDKITIYKMRSKKKMRRKLGYRLNLARFVVDSICFDGKEFYK